MQKLPAALIVIIIILAFIGGYFMGILNSSGNLTLNVTNKSNNSGITGIQTQQHPSTNTVKRVNNTKKNVTPVIKPINKTNTSQ